MSKFSTYVKRVDGMAKDLFKEYAEAKEALERAEAKHKEYPQRDRIANADYAAKAARCYADFVEATDRLAVVKRRMVMSIDKVEAIRRELADAIENDCSIDPEQLDLKTLELLKSGILRSAEFASLMRDAQEAGNITMQRLIGKFAGDAAEEVSAKFGQGDAVAKQLRAVAHQGDASNGRQQLDAFNALYDTYKRTMNNPGMIAHWDRLTADTIENF